MKTDLVSGFGKAQSLLGLTGILGRLIQFPTSQFSHLKIFCWQLFSLEGTLFLKLFSCGEWTFKFGFALCGDFSYSTFVAV